MGEFGRTPKINPAGGRDHHPGVWTILMGGGPIKGGRVVGESDELGYAPKTRPVTPGEVAATLYQRPGPRPAPGAARPAEPAAAAGRLRRASRSRSCSERASASAKRMSDDRDVTTLDADDPPTADRRTSAIDASSRTTVAGAAMTADDGRATSRRIRNEATRRR